MSGVAPKEASPTTCHATILSVTTGWAPSGLGSIPPNPPLLLQDIVSLTPQALNDYLDSLPVDERQTKMFEILEELLGKMRRSSHPGRWPEV